MKRRVVSNLIVEHQAAEKAPVTFNEGVDENRFVHKIHANIKTTHLVIQDKNTDKIRKEKHFSSCLFTQGQGKSDGQQIVRFKPCCSFADEAPVLVSMVQSHQHVQSFMERTLAMPIILLQMPVFEQSSTVRWVPVRCVALMSGTLQGSKPRWPWVSPGAARQAASCIK